MPQPSVPGVQAFAGVDCGCVQGHWCNEQLGVADMIEIVWSILVLAIMVALVAETIGGR